MNRKTQHPDWCAADHTCTAARPGGEHRADPHTLRVPGAGSAVLTRIQTEATGRQHAEVILSVTLPAAEDAARVRLAALLTELRRLIDGTTPVVMATTKTIRGKSQYLTELAAGPRRAGQLPSARSRAA